MSLEKVEIWLQNLNEKTRESNEEYIKIYVNRYEYFNTFISEFKVTRKIIEQLIVNGISRDELNSFIMFDLFDELLIDKFKVNINSKYAEVTSLIPHKRKMKKSNTFIDDMDSYNSSNDSISISQILLPINQRQMIRNNTQFSDYKFIIDIFNHKTGMITNWSTIKDVISHMTYLDHCCLLYRKNAFYYLLNNGCWESFINGRCLLYLLSLIESTQNNSFLTPSQKHKYLLKYKSFLYELISIGCDQNKSFLSLMSKNPTFTKHFYIKHLIQYYDQYTQSRHQHSKILSILIKKRNIFGNNHFIFDTKICDIITSYLPYIHASMIQRLSEQKGMKL